MVSLAVEANPNGEIAEWLRDRLSDLGLPIYEAPVPARDAAGNTISPPYIVLQFSPTPERLWTGGRIPYIVVDVTVKAVVRGSSRRPIQAQAQTIHQRLHNTTNQATPNGGTILQSTRTGRVDFPAEDENRNVFRNLGGSYEIWIQ